MWKLGSSQLGTPLLDVLRKIHGGKKQKFPPKKSKYSLKGTIFSLLALALGNLAVSVLREAYRHFWQGQGLPVDISNALLAYCVFVLDYFGRLFFCPSPST